MDYKSWCALGSMLQNLIPIGFSNTLPRNNKINDTSLLEKEWPYTALNRGISLLLVVKRPNSSTFGVISIHDKIFFYTCIRPLCSLADCCNGVPATCRWDGMHCGNWCRHCFEDCSFVQYGGSPPSFQDITATGSGRLTKLRSGESYISLRAS